MKIISFLLLLLPLVPVNLNGHEGHREEGNPPVAIPENKEALRQINASYLRDIKPIFERTCFDCHSGLTRYPWYYPIPGINTWIDGDTREAKRHIDMTNGFPFKGHGTPQKDFEAIEKVIEKDTMPPFRYKIMHWNSRLSEDDKRSILKWIHGGQKLLEKGSKL